MPTASPSETVTLRGGLTVTLPALQLLWSLEERGFNLRVGPSGRLVVSPASRLTPDERAALREHRDAIVALVRYCEGIQ